MTINAAKFEPGYLRTNFGFSGTESIFKPSLRHELLAVLTKASGSGNDGRFLNRPASDVLLGVYYY